ncbi:MAG: hypothetical protein TREMPRED_001816 [Tremellales sp. Tagirdzhanova-0007]|nr:MAG: hypothetical protein TREMPRED_001816 [Tremellales sp. Tagirdzhanova-0007]
MSKVFATLLLAVSALANPIYTSSRWKRATLDHADFEIINLARNLESLELNLWNQGLNNYTDADFAAANLTCFRNYITLFRDQEIAHFTALNDALGGNFTNCTYTFPVDNVTQFITLGQVITSVGEGAFIGASGNISDSASRQLAAEIIGNEARQNSKLREEIGLDYFGAPNFDTPLTAPQAYSLAYPFLNCPSTNAPIQFNLIPPLTANFVNGTTPHQAGEVIDLSWDAATVSLGSDVHIEFLADQHSIAVPLTQTAAGTGTVVLPPLINGTAFLVATNYAGGGPIPNLQNFAIGYAVVADLTHANSPDLTLRKVLAAEIQAACLTAGFFYVKNHRVPRHVVDEAFSAAKSFFAQSFSVKTTVDISKSDNFRGYMPLLSENNDPKNKGELHEAFNLGLDPSIDPIFLTQTHTQDSQVDSALTHSSNLWPEQRHWSGSEDFKRSNLAYYSALLALGQSLFPLFAMALNLDERFFDDKTRHPAAIMRLLHYPGVPEEERNELNPGIGAHTDFECFTILAQGDVPALQVQKKSGEWIDVPCIPDTFVINIGDQFSRWTNDIFVSTPHRVLPPPITRYSIPFFFGCDHDVPLVPPSTCGPPRYEIISAGRYVAMRLSEVYTSRSPSESGTTMKPSLRA